MVTDSDATRTTIVVGPAAPKERVRQLSRRVQVWVAPTKVRSTRAGQLPVSGIDLKWLLRRLGAEGVVSLLVEGGGETNAAFLLSGLAQRVAFFYAPLVLGGREARKAVAGEGAERRNQVLKLEDLNWSRVGQDWLLTARVTKDYPVGTR